MQYSGSPGHRMDGMVNIPLGERLAARITGFSRYRAGLIDRVTGGGQVIEEDVDYIEDGGFRAQVAWYPSDTLTINALGYYIGSDVGGPGITFHCFRGQSPRDSNAHGKRFRATASNPAVHEPRGLRNRRERRLGREDRKME